MPHSKRTVIAVFSGAICVFAVIAWNVVTSEALAHLDARVAVWLHAHATPALTRFMLFVTHAHGLAAVGAYALVMALILAFRREWDWVLTVGLVVPLGFALNAWLKVMFHRVRPHFDDPLLTLTTPSFPSGHTSAAMLFYGVLAAYVLSHVRDPRLRAACVLLCILLVMLVGLSRMYLGVHYLSDALGAAAWSLAWVALCVLGVRTLQERLVSSSAAK